MGSTASYTAGPDSARTNASGAASRRDADRLPAYYKMLETPADPRRLRELWGALKMGRQIRKRDASVQRDIHELFTRGAGDLLDHWFETDAVKAPYGFDAMAGNYEMPIPPTPDSSLAPTRAHIASMFCQHFAYKLPGGCDGRQEKTRAEDLIFATVESYATNFRASILGHSSLSPLDLEEKLGRAGGDIFHATLGLDQLWAARPVLGYGDHRTPLKSLYLYGAGARPRGGVTGLPGYNAAREIFARRRQSC